MLPEFLKDPGEILNLKATVMLERNEISSTCSGCLAVVVTFNPTRDVFTSTIMSLKGQVAGFIIVDNSEGEFSESIEEWLDCLSLGSITFISNKKNVGIAAAQNVGVLKAIEMGARTVLFSDQDTVFPSQAVPKLLAILQEATDSGRAIAAIGPSYKNVLEVDAAEPFFIRHEGYRMRRIFPGPETIGVGHVISSGMIMPVSAYRVIGGFNEGLFIDWVDIEWCLRAAAMGFEILGCGSICLEHRLGDRVIKYKGRTVVIHSAVRHYFMVRNAVFLARSTEIAGLLVRLRILYSGIRYALFFPLVGRPRKDHAVACLRGLLHGFFLKPPVWSAPRKP